MFGIGREMTEERGGNRLEEMKRTTNSAHEESNGKIEP